MRIQWLRARSALRQAAPGISDGWRNARRALSLLTRLPVSVEWDPAQPWGRLVGWFPVVGLVIGLILALSAVAWNRIADPTLVGSALVLAVWVGLTGGLHLDGLSDCADSFFTPVTREKRLAIMSDPHIGAFGVIGLILALLLKFAGVDEIMTRAQGAPDLPWLVRAIWPLVTAPVAARAVMVMILAHRGIPLARPGGMGARAREGLGSPEATAAAMTGLVVALLGGMTGLVMLLAAAGAGAVAVRLAQDRIGGITGDVLGAAVETGEIAALAAATLVLPY
jgi:adenosylcobinamide-GDP ribazoletransferase